MTKKYQIFVSSTYEDLKEERSAVYEAILGMEHFPVGMEYFGARSKRSIDLIKTFLHTCDFQITIIGTRYGSPISHGKVSYTEMEYDYARKLHIPQMGFILKKNGRYTTDQEEFEKGRAVRLQSFRDKVAKQQSSFWTDRATLVQQVQRSLANELASHTRPGWVRGDQADAYLRDQLTTANNEVVALKNVVTRIRSNIDEENRRRFKADGIAIPDVNGIWQCVEKSTTMEILEHAGMISSHFVTGTHEHHLAGVFAPGLNQFQYQIWRRDRQTRASTVMFGQIENIEPNAFQTYIYATDDKADLMHNFTERLTWKRPQK